jgi:hypothetical protein
MLPAILLALASSQATHTTSATTLHHGVDSHLTVVAADGAPTPDFSLYDITSGPSQLAGVATYNGTELTTVLECFGEGFTEGVGLVCATGGTWTESSDGVDDDDWPGAWSDHTNEAFEMVGSGADALLTPSPTLFDAVSGKDVFVEAVYWPDVSQNQALIDWRDRADNGQGIAIWLDSSEVVRSIADCDGTDTGAASPVGRAGTSIDAWNFASFVFDHNATAGRSISLGVNGGASSYAGDPCTGDMLNVSGVASQARIGDLTQSASTYEFEGKISYIAVRYCDGCVVDEPGGTTSEAYNAERFARLTGTYAADGADKIPSLATRASAGTACHLNASGVRKCDQVGDNWIRTYDVADTGWDDASATHTTGILIEEERTNLAIRSGELNQATHAKNALTISTDTSGGPLGTYDEMIADATTNAHYLRQTTTVASGVTHSVSRILKAGDQDWALINVTTSCGAGGVATSGYFDLSTCDKGTITNASDSFAEEWGDGFCRVGLSWVTSSTSCLIDTASAEADGDFTFLGDGSTATTLWAHGQLEAGAYPSSPIVTSGASVTRSADAFENGQDITGPASMCVKLVTPATDSGSAQYALDVHSGASDFAALLAEDGGDAATFLVSATSTQADITGTDQTDGSAVVLRGYFSDDDFELFEDGSSVGTDTGGTAPASLTDITIGAKQGGTGKLNGVILAVGVYDDTELTDDGVCQ